MLFAFCPARNTASQEERLLKASHIVTASFALPVRIDCRLSAHPTALDYVATTTELKENKSKRKQTKTNKSKRKQKAIAFKEVDQSATPESVESISPYRR